MTTEQLLVESWRRLPEEARQEALKFIQALNQRSVDTHTSSRQINRYFPPPELAGKVEILGDIVSPVVDEKDWECLK